MKISVESANDRGAYFGVAILRRGRGLCIGFFLFCRGCVLEIRF